MNDYSQVPLDALKKIFDEKRIELLAIRNEIDRREHLPTADVDFEKYITK